jgi:hypothetical protein
MSCHLKITCNKDCCISSFAIVKAVATVDVDSSRLLNPLSIKQGEFQWTGAVLHALSCVALYFGIFNGLFPLAVAGGFSSLLCLTSDCREIFASPPSTWEIVRQIAPQAFEQCASASIHGSN